MSDQFWRDANEHEDQSARASVDACQLAKELRVIASQVVKLSGQTPGPIFSSTKELLKEIRGVRKRRTQFFEDELFADPAWDILLELKHAENEQFRVSVSRLCAVAAVPATTALRWITSLENKGMLVRQDDPFDNRRAYISLHSKTSETMERFLQSVVEGTA